ncbi:phosphoribosylformylglycinamidine synthase [Spirochaeta thermophila DSM 6578]|uniref:Phosphoribosylformylglycinamidine synthase n=1 Tax=Winmispira thermophila (strain ATCC 700085 / DSM 6578 / Z-1203) TaxID=869211 RepID=G0GFE0_WINT7|nr:phosphoribosylformylglycinamidine synthase [Spirochaeta thermophila]AEJ61554.1 phosphoribosylformylglycinamidine synthase [Spirochaeta thermophila DSM 6578]
MPQNRVERVFVEKRPEYDVRARHLFEDLVTTLHIRSLTGLRVIHRYDVEGVSPETFERALTGIFAEPPVDLVYREELPVTGGWTLPVELLPGQYDQRADSAVQCLRLLEPEATPTVRYATVYVFEGDLTQAEKERIRSYLINPTDSREARLEKPSHLFEPVPDPPAHIPTIEGFISANEEDLLHLREVMGLAMDLADLLHCQRFFKETAERNPTETEIRLLDTYWSDHCRHTTFLTEIAHLEIPQGPYAPLYQASYRTYHALRSEVYGSSLPPETLMDMATIGMKYLRKTGALADLDESPEVNACSIRIKVSTDGGEEDWLLMFKNETHNHPTEIEPFGGAATCLGGAIRDPLSGRAYVYQAMRVTGSGDPHTPIEETLPGKLPQIKITREAARGYSSYGNQVGLATGQVVELYHPGYVAKRMEIGAVLGAVKAEHVRREEPVPGDVVILVGGRTGRDGIGGATGSSKAHDEKAIEKAGTEVQKGNPPVERHLQRLFRRPEALRLIKRCNDMGAGGVSVSIGEIAPSVDIFLDRVPKKYAGLTATELALSESQERMAVVTSREDAEAFIRYADEENLEATVVAEVTDSGRLRMFWKGLTAVDLPRSFLATNGARRNTMVELPDPRPESSPLTFTCTEGEEGSILEAWKLRMGRLQSASQKGLQILFDSSIGAGTVLSPYGGAHEDTPVDAMVSLIPVPGRDVRTASIMAFGFNPEIGSWSPYHGAFYAVVESVCKVAATGGYWRNVRLSFQEYFPRPGSDPTRWGLPAAALLGALHAQMSLGIPSIGGKDSMSGTYKDLDVPPTLVSFAVTTAPVDRVISPELKREGSKIYLIHTPTGDYDLPDITALMENLEFLAQRIGEGVVISATALRADGIAGGLTRMTVGNRLGCVFVSEPRREDLFCPRYGSFLVEVPVDVPHAPFERHPHASCIAVTGGDAVVIGREWISLEELLAVWTRPLEDVFPSHEREKGRSFPFHTVEKETTRRRASHPKVARPRVCIPVFPGTNCEYDSAEAFRRAGAEVDVLVFRNLTPTHIHESLEALARSIRNAQILMIPGGFSAGDEPEGSGKYIATVFRNAVVRHALEDLIHHRDGLVLGICNGFQALIKLGLVPYGEIRDLEEDSSILTYNTSGHHVARYVRTRLVSRLSPWFLKEEPGAVHVLPVSHTEGRFVAREEEARRLLDQGQVATQYVDPEGNPTMDPRYNPNGSVLAVEGLTSPDGRILGKMAHSERIRPGVGKNIPGHKEERIFESGVAYFL